MAFAISVTTVSCKPAAGFTADIGECSQANGATDDKSEEESSKEFDAGESVKTRFNLFPPCRFECIFDMMEFGHSGKNVVLFCGDGLRVEFGDFPYHVITVLRELKIIRISLIYFVLYYSFGELIMFIDEERLYTIQNESFDFWTGRLGNGNQVLMGLGPDEVTLVEFDLDGNYLRTIERQITKTQEPLNFPYNGPQNREQGTKEILKWQSEIGFYGAAINVKKFFVRDRLIGIDELSPSLRYVEDEPELFTEEELPFYQTLLREWRENKQFVFYWGRDHDMTSDGEVEST